MNRESIDHEDDEKGAIVIDIQLLHQFTHTWPVHNAIGEFGTTVHIPLATVAVHIVAHPAQDVSVTISQSLSPVQLIRGYCVLNVLPDAGEVIVADAALN